VTRYSFKLNVYRQNFVNKSFYLALLLFAPAALAHNVEVAGGIAGTWHIEPDHNPKAGEPAKVWVALTRQGGEVLPFEQANCQMAVYEQPSTEGAKPILQPQLEAIAAEQYQGIPGADVVFPKPGLYQIKLNCTPKTEGSFAPFAMGSDVTVAAGTVPSQTAQSPAVTEPAIAPSSDNGWNGMMQGFVITSAVILVLGLGLLKYLANRAKL
jgi:hypothetical protein